MKRKYRVTYTAEARDSVRHLPPLVKPAIKKLIEKLSEDPSTGKALREELSGYWSQRFQRWRVIYIVENESHTIEIQLIEKRKTVYETLKEFQQ